MISVGLMCTIFVHSCTHTHTNSSVNICVFNSLQFALVCVRCIIFLVVASLIASIAQSNRLVSEVIFSSATRGFLRHGA